MSPTSQSVLEVERYIGNYLISPNCGPSGSHQTNPNKKQQEPTIRGKPHRSCYASSPGNYAIVANEQCQMQYPGGNNWDNPSSRRCCNSQRLSPPLGGQSQYCCDQQQQQQQHLLKSPLSRLAIHTQGAPLILAGRVNNRQVKLHNNNNNNNIINNNNTNCTSNSLSSYPHVPRMESITNRIQKQYGDSNPRRTQQTNNPKSTMDCTSSGKDNNANANTTNIDSLSVASDESSGSNNSENSLPRIIKPRKRRKKDRKPANNPVATDNVKLDEQQQQGQHVQQQQGQQIQSTPQNRVSACSEQTYGPVYENNCSYPVTRNHRRAGPIVRENVYNNLRTSNQGTINRSFQGKELLVDDNRNVVCNNNNSQPKGFRNNYNNHQYRNHYPPHHHHHHQHHHHHHHHRHENNGMVGGPRYHSPSQHQPREFKDSSGIVGRCEDAYGDGLDVCQCRYCDPCTAIWEMDQNCYPNAFPSRPQANHHPTGSSSPHYPQLSSLYMPRVNNCQDENSVDRLFDSDNNLRLLQNDRDSSNCPILRRSWSDPTSYFSDDMSIVDVPSSNNKDVGVIGDRGLIENNGVNRRRTLWRGDTLGVLSNASSSNDYSANTNEVVGGVTSSLQGLEVSTEIVTSPNGHRDLEIKFYSPSSSSSVLSQDDKSKFDDEDRNILSYHEFKLQKDFRILLQAEG